MSKMLSRMKLLFSLACMAPLLLANVAAANNDDTQNLGSFIKATKGWTNLWRCIDNYHNSLQVLHSSDNESSFQDPNTLEEKILNYSSVLKGLHYAAQRECTPGLHLTAGDHTIPGPFYRASEEAFGAPGLADIMMFNDMRLSANGMGNHEFDGGINDFSQMLNFADYPFIAVNLDFSNVVLEEGMPEINIGKDAQHCALSRGKVVKSCWLVRGGHKVGLIGRAPAEFFNVVEDPETTLPGLDFVGGRDANNQPLVSALEQVLAQVNKLERRGVKRIILLDHAQDFTGDPLSASALRGVDIIVSAGSTGFMAKPMADGPFNLLRPEDTAESDYPTVRQDSEGETVLVVNSDQQYRYVGNLIVRFNRRGHITAVDSRSGPVATTADAIAALASELRVSNITPISRVADTFSMLQQTDLIQDAFFAIGTTNYPLNGLRGDVRTRETNLGNLAADSSIWGARQNGFPQVDVALKNGGGIRDTIVGPAIIRLNLQAALAFDNTLTVLELTGEQLLAVMENGVSRAEFADGRFPQVAGLVMEFDAGFPAIESAVALSNPSRVRNLTVTKSDGTEVVLVSNGVANSAALADTFVIATNSFTATGGDGYAAFPAATVLGATTIGEQQILADYITNVLGGTVDMADDAGNPQRIFRLN